MCPTGLFPPRLTARRPPALATLLPVLLLCLSLSAVQARDPRSIGEWLERLERAEEAFQEEWSVQVRDLSTGEVLLEHDPDRLVIPASNRKIATFALALERFGPEYRFSTQLGLTPGGRNEDGWITSSLVMQSNGDPSFSRKYLRNKNPADYLQGWIRHLDTLGLTRFQGAFFIDASAFGAEQQIYPATWDYDNRHQSFAAIPSAVTINGNLIQVRAYPSSSKWAVGRIRLYPDGAGLGLRNETRTVSGRVRGLKAEFSVDGGELLVRGGLGQRAGTQVVLVPLARPLDFIKAVVEEALEEEGVEVQGGVHILTDPRQADGLRIDRVVARHEAPPLPELLGTMMRDSDNFFAEQFWRAAAHRATGLGTMDAARRTEQEWLDRHGLAWVEPGYDGSGLSRLNRISAGGQIAVLEAIFNSPYGAYLFHSLPESGRSGTLKRRDFDADRGRVLAKTGTLTGVSALSGFILDTEERPRWVFSLIGNAPRGTKGRLTVRQNQIMKLLIHKLDGREEPLPERVPMKRRERGLKVYVEHPS